MFCTSMKGKTDIGVRSFYFPPSNFKGVSKKFKGDKQAIFTMNGERFCFGFIDKISEVGCSYNVKLNLKSILNISFLNNKIRHD